MQFDIPKKLQGKFFFSTLSAALWLKFWLEVLYSLSTDAWMLFPKILMANQYLGYIWDGSEKLLNLTIENEKGYKKLNTTLDRAWSHIAFACLLLSAEVACCIWHFRDGNSFFRVHLRLYRMALHILYIVYYLIGSIFLHYQPYLATLYLSMWM